MSNPVMLYQQRGGKKPQGTPSYPQYYTTSAGAYSPASNPYAANYQSPYATGVSGYGSWHYPYGYVAHQPHMYTTTSIPTAGASTVPTSQGGPQRTTFAAYTPYTPYPSRKDTSQTAGATVPGATGRLSRKPTSYKGLFAKDLKSLMYAFGDDRNPANDTVNVMEEILVEFILDVCQMAAGSSRKTRLSIEDIRRVLSRPPDAKKLARMEELLFMQEVIKRARAQFPDSDLNQSIAFKS